MTHYGLDGSGFEPQGGVKFSAPIQTGREAHSASCTMCTGALSQAQSSWDVTLTTHLHLALRLKEV
jgi:hypothetical protein